MDARDLIPPPADWSSSVLTILREGDPAKIEWTLRADQDWGQFGMKHEAYSLLIETLSIPSTLAEPVEMDGALETYAFLCRHPLDGPKPLYAKVGLQTGRLSIKIYSMHVDLLGKLQKKISERMRSK